MSACIELSAGSHSRYIKNEMGKLRLQSAEIHGIGFPAGATQHVACIDADDVGAAEWDCSDDCY